MDRVTVLLAIESKQSRRIRNYVIPLRASFASKNGIPVVKKGGMIDRTGKLESHSQVRN